MVMNASINGTTTRGEGLRGLLLRFIRGLEQWRLKTHFKFVDANLRNADVSHLSPELRAARAKNIELLREYAARGVFPKNLDFPGQRIPYFKDAFGTPCAVGNLMERTGAQAVVDDINATNNHVYVNDIRGGPAMDWIRRSGLTQAEAAMIQPAYEDWCCAVEYIPDAAGIHALISEGSEDELAFAVRNTSTDTLIELFELSTSKEAKKIVPHLAHWQLLSLGQDLDSNESELVTRHLTRDQLTVFNVWEDGARELRDYLQNTPKKYLSVELQSSDSPLVLEAVVPRLTPQAVENVLTNLTPAQLADWAPHFGYVPLSVVIARKLVAGELSREQEEGLRSQLTPTQAADLESYISNVSPTYDGRRGTEYVHSLISEDTPEFVLVDEIQRASGITLRELLELSTPDELAIWAPHLSREQLTNLGIYLTPEEEDLVSPHLKPWQLNSLTIQDPQPIAAIELPSADPVSTLMLAWVAVGAACAVLAFVAMEWTKFRLLQSNGGWILRTKRLYASLRPQSATTKRAKLLYAAGVNLAAAAVVGLAGFGISVGIDSLI